MAKLVPKHEHNICVNPLASIPMGKTYLKNQEMCLGCSLCYMTYSLQSYEYDSDPIFSMWEGTLLTTRSLGAKLESLLKCL